MHLLTIQRTVNSCDEKSGEKKSNEIFMFMLKTKIEVFLMGSLCEKHKVKMKEEEHY